MKTDKRIYLDINASSPLAPPIIEWLTKGDFLCANASSLHAEGRSARKLINETKDYLFETFGLSPKEFHLIFHSGATEGITWILAKSLHYLQKKLDCKKSDLEFIYSPMDHMAVCNLAKELRSEGFELNPINHTPISGEMLETSSKKPQVINYTWVNNETGQVFNLEDALKLKKNTESIIHIDGAQSIGKIENFRNLNKNIDAYTFSGHKFGSFKGVGFSFIKKSLKLDPLLVGANQQNSLRGGTENVEGIYSLKLALQYLIENFDSERLITLRDQFEKGLENFIQKHNLPVTLVSQKLDERNLNTTFLILEKISIDAFVTALDLKGLSVSKGSACKSGSSAPNHVLKNLGYSEEKCRQGLRISFSPLVKENDILESLSILRLILTEFYINKI